MFWLGYLTAIATYLLVGFVIGIWFLFNNLARFHGAGFQWKRMMKYLGVLTIFWPSLLVEMLVPEEF